MKPELTFKQLVTAFLAAGSPGASEDQACEAEALAGLLSFSIPQRGQGVKDTHSRR